MQSTSFPNGTPKVFPVKSSTIDWYPKRQSDVIAIDFGTSTLAVAYKVKGNVNELKIQEGCSDAYIPTVLLIKPGDATQSACVEIGERALRQYSKIENIDVKHCVFFERVKLNLQNDETVSHKTAVLGSDGNYYYVIEVIALILKNVRQKLVTYFETRGNKYSIEQFHWVLTIPALWGERARDMMRAAAYLAGLCSSHPKWDELLSLPLKPAKHMHLLRADMIKQYELHPERLSLVYEPDAAAAWCKQLSEEDVRDCGDAAPPLATDNFFLTIDVGGGTIDVTAHQVLAANGQMKRVNIPHGEVYGGAIINQTFKKYLENEVVRDPNFSRYLSSKKDKAENEAELYGLIYHEFEQSKITFAESNSRSESYFIVQLPFQFSVIYQRSLQRFKDKNIDKGHDVVYKQRTKQLQISRQKMISFFNPNMAKLYECITTAKDAIVQKYGNKFEIFYLVGGFGGCRYVADDIHDHYKRYLKVVIPKNHHLAVVKGACVYYDENILLSADATYGLGVSTLYDSSNPVHIRGSEIVSDTGESRCNYLFQPIVQIGQVLENDSVFVYELHPFNKTNTSAEIAIYTGLVEYVDFTKDEQRLKKVATLTLDISEGMHLPVHKRFMDVLFDFNGIEIKVYARYRYNNRRVKASIDFLSTLDKFDIIK